MTEPLARADRLRALAVLVFGAVVIGLAPILVRLAECGPAAAGFWRLVFALPLLWLMAWRSGPGTLSARPRAVWVAGVMFALDLVFWHYSIALTSVANATVLTNLTPVVVTAFAWAFLRQRPGRLFLLAVALAVSGAWMMAAAKGGKPGINPPLGDALALATTLWYAFYMLAVAQARQRAAATPVMFWSTATGIPLMLLFMLGLGEQLIPAGPGGWLAVMGLGAMHVAGQGSIAWALGRLPAATASVVVLIQPVVATGLGWLLFQETLTPTQGLGAVVALAGIALAQWASLPPKSAAQPSA